jgi:hypothetical protein
MAPTRSNGRRCDRVRQHVARRPRRPGRSRCRPRAASRARRSRRHRVPADADGYVKLVQHPMIRRPRSHRPSVPRPHTAARRPRCKRRPAIGGGHHLDPDRLDEQVERAAARNPERSAVSHSPGSGGSFLRRLKPLGDHSRGVGGAIAPYGQPLASQRKRSSPRAIADAEAASSTAENRLVSPIRLSSSAGAGNAVPT